MTQTRNRFCDLLIGVMSSSINKENMLSRMYTLQCISSISSGYQLKELPISLQSFPGWNLIIYDKNFLWRLRRWWLVTMTSQMEYAIRCKENMTTKWWRMVKKLKSVADELKLPFHVFKAVRKNQATVISGKLSLQGALGPPNKLCRSLLKSIKRRWK